MWHETPSFEQVTRGMQVHYSEKIDAIESHICYNIVILYICNTAMIEQFIRDMCIVESFLLKSDAWWAFYDSNSYIKNFCH